MIDILFITDGRHGCLARAWASAMQNVVANIGRIGRVWIYTDSAKPEDRRHTQATYSSDTVFWHPEGRQGFGGAVRYAWEHVAANSDATHLFHLEDDFTFNRPVPLGDMAAVLDAHPYLAQMALRRQPWNAAEIAAGGVVELQPDEFVEQSWWQYVDRPTVGPDPQVHLWLEHRLFWTTNPALIRMDHIRQHPWPDVAQSEGVYTLQLTGADPDLRFGYWGSRDSGEWVHHIGDERVGTGY